MLQLWQVSPDDSGIRALTQVSAENSPQALLPRLRADLEALMKQPGLEPDLRLAARCSPAATRKARLGALDVIRWPSRGRR